MTPSVIPPRRRLAIESVAYMLSNYAAFPLTTACNLLMRRELGPYLAGVYGSVLLVGGYFMFANLGVLTAAERDLPTRRGARDAEGYDRVARAAGGFGLLAGGVVATLFAVVVLVFRQHFDDILLYGLLFIAAMSVVQQWIDYQITLLRTSGEFLYLSRHTFVAGVALASGGLAGATVGGFYGLLFGLTVVALWRAVVLTLRTGAHRIAMFDRPSVVALLRRGVPMLAVGIVITVAQTFDGILILRYLGVESLGLYSLAASAGALILGLTKAGQAVLYPRMMEEYGRTKDQVQVVVRYVAGPLEITGFLLPIPIAALYLGLPVVALTIMPSFAAGFPAVQANSVATYFWAMAQLPLSYLTSFGRWRFLCVSLGSALAVQYAVASLLTGEGYGLVGVCVGSGCGYFVAFTLAVGVGLDDLPASRRSHVVAVTVVPPAVMGCLLWAVYASWGVPDGAWWEQWLGAGARYLAFAFVYLAFLAAWPLRSHIRAWLRRRTNMPVAEAGVHVPGKS